MSRAAFFKADHCNAIASATGRCMRAATSASETLCQHAVHGRGYQERLNVHLDETGDRAGCVVGVQGREYEVAGEGRLHGDLGRLEVANLAHENHVG